ncbi:MAG: helix-turn-helix domain-containing protein [Streptosporangiaceae bacterium]
MLTIGEFARAARLSPKALRLYDELDLLKPARTDPSSGYRYYEDSQLAHARLVAWLRRLGIPLAEIKEIHRLPANEVATAITAYWARTEIETAHRRDLATFLIDTLHGRESSMEGVQVRHIPERTLLSIQRHLTADQLGPFATELVLRIGDGTVPALPGIEGAPFLIYYGAVDDDSDGPVEFCRPVPPGQAEEIASRFPDLVLRREPAHQEAYIRLTKAEMGPTHTIAAFYSLDAWARQHDLTHATAARTVFIADLSKAKATDPVMDIAGTIKEKKA